MAVLSALTLVMQLHYQEQILNMSVIICKFLEEISGRSQHAVDELEYLVTFNRSITQVWAWTMQGHSEGIFINMANLNLARRDSYLEYICAGHSHCLEECPTAYAVLVP